MREFLQENIAGILQKTGEHLAISFISLLLAIAVAVPLGILLTRHQKLARPVIAVASVLQTVPSLALLAIMIPIFGVGRPPAIAALFIYALLPILRNTYLAIGQVDPGVRDAAKGMGMTTWQLLFHVELPLGIPMIMAGIRLSAVYVIAWTTLASYIGAGGLGDFIFTGLQNYMPAMILAGTIPVTILALLADLLLGNLEHRLSPLRKIKGGAV